MHFFSNGNEISFCSRIFIAMYTRFRFLHWVFFFNLFVSRIAALDKFLYYFLVSILLMWDYTFFSLHFTYGITSFNSQCLGAWFHNMHRDTAEPSIKKRKGSFYTLTCLFRITLKHWWQQGIIVPAVELGVLPWAIVHPATALCTVCKAWAHFIEK